MVLLNFKEDGGILVTLKKKLFKKLEKEINDMLNDADASADYCFQDILNIFEDNGIEIEEGDAVVSGD